MFSLTIGVTYRVATATTFSQLTKLQNIGQKRHENELELHVDAASARIEQYSYIRNDQSKLILP